MFGDNDDNTSEASYSSKNNKLKTNLFEDNR